MKSISNVTKSQKTKRNKLKNGTLEGKEKNSKEWSCLKSNVKTALIQLQSCRIKMMVMLSLVYTIVSKVLRVFVCSLNYLINISSRSYSNSKKWSGIKRSNVDGQRNKANETESKHNSDECLRWSRYGLHGSSS